MASQDPITRRLQAMQTPVPEEEEEKDPIQARLDAMQQQPQEEDPGFLSDVAVGLGALVAGTPLGQSVEQFLRLTGYGEAADRAAAFRDVYGLGVAEAAVLKPAQGITSFLEDLHAPGSHLAPVLDGTNTVMERATDAIVRIRSGVRTEMERDALAAGIPDWAMGAAEGMGEFVGFTLPMVGAFKAAPLLTGIGATVGEGIGAGTTVARGVSKIVWGNVLNDTAAGIIYGGLLTPAEDMEERAYNALRDGGLFAAFAIGLRGLTLPFTVVRFRRAINKLKEDQVNRYIDLVVRRDIAGKEITSSDPARSIFELMSEENFILGSPAAQAMLERSADERALVQGILDAAGSGGNRGVVPSFRAGSLEELGPVLERFRAEFPSLQFETVRRGPETFDVYFGTRGLNNAQRAQLKKEGLFEGQKVIFNGEDYGYVRAVGGNRVRIRDLTTGQEKNVGQKNITPRNWGVDPELRTPSFDALYEDYRNFYYDKARETVRSRGALTDFDMQKAVREGRLAINENQRRIFRDPYAIVYPEEAGLNPYGELRNGWTLEMDAAASNPEQGAYFFKMIDAAGNVRPEGITGQLASEGTFVVDIPQTVQRGELGNGNIRRLFRMMKDMVESTGQKVSTVGGLRTTGAGPGRHLWLDADKLAAERGGEYIYRTRPPEPVTHENVFAAWVRERGLEHTTSAPARGEVGRTVAEATHAPEAATERALAKMEGSKLPELAPSGGQVPEATAKIVEQLRNNPAGLAEMRASFAPRLRRELWESVPAEDRAVYQTLKDEYNTLVAGKGDDLQFQAAMKGYVASVTPEGKVMLRDFNTGARHVLEDEATALEALRGVQRTGDAVFDGGQLPPGFGGGGPPPGGMNPADEVWTFPDNILEREFTNSLPPRLLTNKRDWFERVEEITDIPLWSKGFEPISRGVTARRNWVAPWSKQIRDAWKGLSRDDKILVGQWWRRIEGQDIPQSEALQIGRQMGLEGKHFNAAQRAREIWTAGFAESGISEARFIENYFGRVQPYAEAHGGRWDPTVLRQGTSKLEREFWAEMSRTGELAVTELDPEIVMYKWFNSLGYKKFIKEPWERVAKVVGWEGRPGLKIKDLPIEQQNRIFRDMPEHLRDPEQEVVHPIIQNIMKEYLTTIRGYPNAGLETSRRYTQSIFDKLGVKAEDTVVDQFVNMAMSTMYGSAMGLRVMLNARNFTQTMWMLYPRLGGRYGGEGLGRALTMDGFKESLEAGAIRATEGGIPLWDAIVETQMANMPRGEGVIGTPVAAALRAGLRVGNISQKTAQKFLIPYMSIDQINRAWAYHWQKLHTADLLRQFKAGKISEAKFLEDGLPFFKKPVKDDFLRLLRSFGDEEALQFIGRQAANEAHFIYGMGAQQTWMQKTYGRFLGMFGTWPMWAKETYVHRFADGTLKQKAAFTIRTGAMVTAISNMMAQTGINLWSWIAPLSMFQWAGGPALNYMIDAKNVIDAPLQYKASALQRMSRDVTRLGFPGQVFIRDIQSAIATTDDPREQALLMMVGRPSDEHFAMRFLFDPEAPPGVVDPEREAESQLPPEAFVPPKIDISGGGEEQLSSFRIRHPVDVFGLLGGNKPRR